MKEYTYKNTEINLIQKMLDNPPKKIWWDFTCYIFDYRDYYIKLESVDKEADTQNESDQAVIAELTKIDKRYKPTKDTTLVCQDKKIDSVYIVQTFLYFTNYRKYSKPERFLKRTVQKVKNKLIGEDTVGDLLSETIGGYESIICHSKSEHAKKINSNYANLLDVGLLFEIEGKWLRAYLEYNGYGFHIWNDKYFFDTKDFEEDKQLYDFIKIENK